MASLTSDAAPGTWPSAVPTGDRAEQPDWVFEVRSLVARDKKVEAVKRTREETGLGLKEAKDYVDRL